MKTFALIKDETVVNIILWAGPEVTPVDFGEGVTFTEINDKDGHMPMIGCIFKDGDFISPEKEKDDVCRAYIEKVDADTKQKNLLLSEATQKITMLQDAIDLGVATGEESDLLIEMKKYRLMLNSTNVEVDGNINWPVMPK
ncbi:tail fiber assembly protein [Enterobacter quasiroggenkampii]|uniref:tail fiber assembly protein n=1 Tax=Enterobacter quasiroggenkampii TaxID=2497436 RepID=UPI001F28F4EC|nr:tail fiber assembly protein [Enterobacter quasiroggenkampii]